MAGASVAVAVGVWVGGFVGEGDGGTKAIGARVGGVNLGATNARAYRISTMATTAAATQAKTRSMVLAFRDLISRADSDSDGISRSGSGTNRGQTSKLDARQKSA